MLSQRYQFVTDSFSSDLAARLLEEETLPYQFGPLREAIYRAFLALESAQIWLERGRVFCASASQKDVVYLVRANRCTCPAKRLCFHRVARRLLLRFFALARAIEADMCGRSGSAFFEQPAQPELSVSLTLH